MQDTGPQKIDIDETAKQIQLCVDNIIGVHKCSENFFLSLEKYINWSFAACLATLLWFVGGFDKFKVNGTFYNKYSFVLAAVLLLASVVCFGVYRYVLYHRAIIESRFLENVGALPYGFPKWKLPNGEKAQASMEDILEHITTVRKSMDDLDDFAGHWGGNRSVALERGGMMFYLAGLVLVSFYVISLIFNIDEMYLIRLIIGAISFVERFIFKF